MNIKLSLDEIMKIDGAQCAALVDSTSGMMLGSAGGGLDIEVAAAGNTEVVRAKAKTMKALGVQGEIEDMLITLTSAYHIIRPMAAHEGLFLYAVLDKSRSNLAMARRKIADVEKALEF